MEVKCQPTVSVIVPCYNDGAYLEQAITSALAQTMPALEVLVVDDGSTDAATKEVLSRQSDSRVRVLHTPHVGPAQARNAAIREAHGRYILPLDADDWIESEYLSSAAAVLDSRPEVGIVYCQAELFGEKTGPWLLPPFQMDTFLLDNCIFITSMFRREDWEDVGGFCADFQYGLEDYDFWLSLVEHGRQVVQLPESYFHYRIKPASRSRLMIDNVRHTQETYALLYQRHRTLYQAHMDSYAQGLRRELIVQKFRNGCTDAQSGSAAQAWQSILELNPGFAQAVMSFVRNGHRFKEACRRIPSWIRRK